MFISASIFYQRCSLGSRFSNSFLIDLEFWMRFHTNVAHFRSPYDFVASVAVYEFRTNVAVFYFFNTSGSKVRCSTCFWYNSERMSLLYLFLVRFGVKSCCFWLFLVRIRVNVMIPTRVTADPTAPASRTFLGIRGVRLSSMQNSVRHLTGM